MAAITSILTGVGIAAGLVGAGVQYMGQQQAADDSKKAQAAQREAESKRQQQMNLDADRKQRSIIREAQMQRAQALAAATSSGAQYGDGLQGGFAGVEGGANTNMVGVQQNRELGNSMFTSNALASNYQSKANNNSMVQMGSGLSSLGNGLVKNAGAIDRIGSSWGIWGA